jgi:phosphatidylglycerophosphate synthase
VIDDLYKEQLDKFWDRCGVLVARTGVSANAVTLIGLFLGAANALWFVDHRNMIVFGLLLALTELLDNVDGAVARVTGQSCRAGAYLDATTDRYKEIFPLLAIAYVTNAWFICFLAITGSLLVSYNHARAAAEGAVRPTRRGLPDFFERFERVATLCIGLVVSPLLPTNLAFGYDFLFLTLCALAVMTHITAIQRLLRGWRSLLAADSQP